MAAEKKSRELDSRELQARALEMYTPASLLPEPTPEPGKAFHWVATHVMGQSDPTNVSKKFREGWEPEKAVDHPELQIVGDKNGNIEIGGLMLCSMPEERARARDAYYNAQAQAQMDSVNNHFMKNNDPRMPLFTENRSEVRRGGFGSGSK
jgi:hypothetical protein